MKITSVTLFDYVNNDLSPTERERVGAALERDPRLRAELDQLQRLHTGLQAALDPIRDVPIVGRPPAGAFGRARPPRRIARVALLAAVVLASFWMVGQQRPASPTGGAGSDRHVAIVPPMYVTIDPVTPTLVPATPAPAAMTPTATAPTSAAPELGSPEWYDHLTISPSLTLRGEVAETALTIEVRGTIGYALISRPEAEGNSVNLVALDLTDPSRPIELGSVTADPESHTIAVDGTLAIASSPRGFDVFDISQPAQIELIGRFADAQQTSTRAVALRAGRAYVASYGGERFALRFTIVDMSDSANPHLLGALVIGGAASEGLEIAGEFAYVPDAANGLHVIDISAPAAPRLVASFATSGLRTVRVVGERAYLGTDYGLEIIDVSDPEAPALLARVPALRGGISGIALAGTTLFVSFANYGSTAFGGIEVYEVSDPGRPILLGGYSGQANANAVWSDGERAYVAHDRRGLLIMELTR